jgi:hypothetical protein
MQTVTADWSVLDRPKRKSGRWLSNVRARLHRAVGSGAARRQDTREGGQKSRDAFVQADVAAFISAFMRVG